MLTFNQIQRAVFIALLKQALADSQSLDLTHRRQARRFLVKLHGATLDTHGG